MCVNFEHVPISTIMFFIPFLIFNKSAKGLEGMTAILENNMTTILTFEQYYYLPELQQAELFSQTISDCYIDMGLILVHHSLSCS